MNLFSVCQRGDFIEMDSKWIKIVSLDLLPSFILLIATPTRALSLQPASPSTCLHKPSPFCHSPTNPNNSPFLLLLSLRLTGSRGYWHSGHAQSFTYWYWFFFPPSSYLESLYRKTEWNGGQDGEQQIEFCLAVEDGALPQCLFTAAGWSEGAQHPTVPLWLPFSRIDLTLGPATPRETGAWRHAASFVEGDSPVQSDSRQRW